MSPLVAQGIDPETAAIIDAMPAAEFGDAYSACCRPGSWEFSTSWAMDMHARLAAAGYRAVQDPEVSYRARWVRAGQPGAGLLANGDRRPNLDPDSWPNCLGCGCDRRRDGCDCICHTRDPDCQSDELTEDEKRTRAALSRVDN